MNVKKCGKIHIKAPKGYGSLKYNDEEINFTNAITIFGKAHIHNAILHNIWKSDEKPTIYKVTGVSILFRRCHDDATNTDPTLNKSLFEVNIVRKNNGNTATANKGFAHSKSFQLIPNSTEGHKVDGSVAYLQIGTGTEAFTASDNSGCWGDSETDGTLLESIWSVTTNAGSSPAKSGVGLKADRTNNKKARIMGISLITGGQYGNWNEDAINNDTVGTTLSKKVWRDPSYMQLLHDQESKRTDFGLANNVRPPVVSTVDSTDIKNAGHYFPSVTDFNAVKASDDLTQAESQGVTADVWRWEDVAHDTFSHTFFPTHWYSSQVGYTTNPYGAGSIADDHRGDSNITSTLYANNPDTVYTTTLSSAITFAFKDPNTVYDSTNNGANEYGDGILPTTCNTYEVDYNTAGIPTPDHLVDANDQISARYSIDFSHLATNPFDMNDDYGLANSVNANLGTALASDFGQAGNSFDETIANPASAITHVELVDEAGTTMKNKNGGAYNEDKVAIADASTVTNLTPIKFSINNGETFINEGSSSHPDTSSERERFWQTTIELTFDNVNKIPASAVNGNPDKVKFYNGSNVLFTIQLADDDSVALHDVQLPGVTPGSGVTNLFTDLSDGADFPGTTWEDDNNLVVTVTLYTG